MAVDAPEPIIAAQKAALTSLGPATAIMIEVGTDIVPSPLVMMPTTATPPHSPTTGLVFSRKYEHLVIILFFLLSSFNMPYFTYWFSTGLCLV